MDFFSTVIKVSDCVDIFPFQELIKKLWFMFWVKATILKFFHFYKNKDNWSLKNLVKSSGSKIGSFFYKQSWNQVVSVYSCLENLVL